MMTIKEDLDNAITESLKLFDNPPSRQGRPPLAPGADFASPATAFITRFNDVAHTQELVNPLTHVSLMLAAKAGRDEFKKVMEALAESAVSQHPLAS